MRVAALLLAAGAGRRMGADENKLLLSYRGSPLVCHLAKVALASRCDEVYVVVGARSQQVSRVLPAREVRIVPNPDWSSGIAGSIRQGVAAIASKRPDIEAIVVLLADQARVTTAHIDALLDAHQRAPSHLVATRYAGVEAVPALFPRRSFEALMQLSGDAGARQLLKAEGSSQHLSDPAAGRLLAIDFEAAALDLDTPEDYASLSSRERR